MDNVLNEQLHRLLELKIQRNALVAEIESKIEELEIEKLNIAESLDEQIALLEEEIKPQVLKARKSIKFKNINAVYVRRRTWDSNGLAYYAKEHPIIMQFEKISESVHFRFKVRE